MEVHNHTETEGHNPTVAQLAISHPGALAVFNKYNIDYCCGGQRSLENACMRLGLQPEQVKAEIFFAAVSESPQQLRADLWNSGLLIDFINENHHAYVRKSIPEVQVLLSKVCIAHGNDFLELHHIREKFDDLADELVSHMQKEELVLFPAIKRLEAHDGDNYELSVTIQRPLEVMEHEHDVAGQLVKQIRLLSNNYTPPDFACPTFKIMYKKLQEFDEDLVRHIHLENNILFPRVKGWQSMGGSCSI